MLKQNIFSSSNTVDVICKLNYLKNATHTLKRPISSNFFFIESQLLNFTQKYEAYFTFFSNHNIQKSQNQQYSL